MTKQWEEAIRNFQIPRVMPRLCRDVENLLKKASTQYHGRRTNTPAYEIIGQKTVLLAGIDADRKHVERAGIWEPKTHPIENHPMEVAINIEFLPNRSVLMHVIPCPLNYPGTISKSKGVHRVIYPGEQSVEIGVLEDDVIPCPQIAYFDEFTPPRSHGFRSEVRDELLRCLNVVEK